jgi:hypothetical protein
MAWGTRAGIATFATVLALALAACGGDDDATTSETLPSDAELDAAAEEVLSDCPLPDETVAEAVGEEIEFSTDLSGGHTEANLGIDESSGDLAVTWSGCAYTAVAGGEYTVAEYVDEAGNPDASGYELIASQKSDSPSGEAAEPAEGIGDEAVEYRDQIHFKLGDHAYVVSGQDKNFEPLDASEVEGLALAAAQNLG